MAEDRLSQEEVALVLRRAAELDPETARPPEEGMSVAAVTAAAAEVGLPAAAVQQAVAELRAGALTGPDAAPLDPAIVVEALVIPLDGEAATGAVGRWLTSQTFRRHRARDGVEVWRLREDWIAGMQRGFDWASAVRLKGVRQVVVRAVAVDDGTLVRLEAAVGGAASKAPAAGATLGAVPGTAGATLALMAPSVALMAVGAGVAGAGAAGGYAAGRSVRRSSQARVRDELAAALDRIASGIDERNAIERLRDRARSRPGAHRGAWHRA